MAYTKTNWLDRAVGWARRFFMNSDGGNDKNLLPPFSDWTLHANAVATANYTLTLTATASSQSSLITIPCAPSTQYTANCAVSAGGDFFVEYFTDVAYISGVYSRTSPYTFTTPANATRITFGVRNTSATGSFTFTNPQLELGSSATAFTPKKLYTITQSPGTVTQAGTPINAANLNKMEQGIYDAHVTADGALQRSGGTITGTVITRDVALAPQGTTANTWSSPLYFQYKDGSNNPQAIFLQGDPSGTIKFNGSYAIWSENKLRVHSSGTYIEWFNGTVWQGVGGVKNIQRGLYTANPGTNNVTISAVGSLAKASVNYLTSNNSWTDGSSGTSSVSIRLTSTTNLEITNGLNGVATAQVSWEVIEYY